MAKIALRAYNREIETLIDRGQIEEAIAHCKYILRFFPKHIETYRLLGKAYIESQRYSEAADILQRILSVLPDDFIAQVGMSIIREDENNLDAAIFHMEHAHEIQPSNAAVQDELRRLYGRRDGVEPPRLRLTRGALVRLYAKGDLYRQAIAEIRAALAEDPNRFDLEVILARMYYLLGQKVEATDAASRLVAKLPYCMEANRILAEILPTTARADDAKNYLTRVFALDPYLAYISTNAPTINLVPDNAVTLDHLEFQSSAAGEEQPAWAQTAGITITGAEEAEAIPEWLTPAPEVKQPAEPAAAAQPPVPTPAPEAAPAVSSEMPDWMQGAGWGASAQGVQETSSVEEEAAAPGELPDWLKEMAPKQETAPQPQESDLKIDWLDQILPETESAQTSDLDFPASEEIFAAPSDQEAGLSPAEAPGVEAAGAAYEETLPAWLTFPEEASAEAKPVSAEVAPEIAQPVTEVETVPVEASPEIESVPAEVAPEVTQPTAEFEPVPTEYASELAQPAAEVEPVPAEAAPEIAQPSAEVEPILTEAAPEILQAAAEIEPVPAYAVSEFVQPAPEVEPVPAEAIPEITLPTAEVEPVPAEAAPEIPQPFAAAGELPPVETPEEEITKPIRVVSAAPTPEPQPQPDWNDLDAAMAWLEGLAAKQGADQETLSTTAEQRPETPPDWVKQEQEKSRVETPVAGLSPAPVAETEALQHPEIEVPPVVPIAESAPEMPVEPTAEVVPETPLPAPAETMAETSAPVVVAEAPVAEAPAAEAIGIQPAVVSTTPAPPAAAEEMDADAAFAWLESLAAQQGADEATLSTSKEERQAAPPAWVTEVSEPVSEVAVSAQPEPEPVASEPEAPAPQVVAPEIASEAPLSPELPAVEVPQITAEAVESTAAGEWLQEVRPPAAPEPAPEPEPAAPVFSTQPQAEPLPAWLQGIDQPPVETRQLVSPEGMEDLPDWLKGFDTPQETPAAPAGAESISVSTWLNEQEIPAQEPIAPVKPAAEQPLPVVTQPVPVIPEPVAAAPVEVVPSNLKGFSTSGNPLIAQAQAHLGGGRIDPALDLYNQVIGQGQNLDAVIQDLTNATYRYPVDPSLWQALGDAYMRNDQIQQALDAYTKAEEFLR